MAFTLSSADFSKLASCQQTLLSPLDYPSLDRWRAAANRDVRSLLGASCAAFAVPGGPGVPVYSDDVPQEAIALYSTRIAEDPGWERALSMGLAFFTSRTLVAGDWNIFYRSWTYNEIYRPFGWSEGSVLTAGQSTAPACGMLVALHDRALSERQHERELALLELLLPAFKAGVRSALREAQHRTTLANALDDMTSGARVCDAGGSVLHENPALARLLAGDPERQRIESALRQVALDMAALLCQPVGAERASAVGGTTPLLRRVRTAAAHYVVRATLLGPGQVTRDPAVLVVVERQAPVELADAELRACFGLTPREIAVARQLASGKTIPAVARALAVSPHTVRHHAEHVYQKLGVHTRAEVARVLGGGVGAGVGRIRSEG